MPLNYLVSYASGTAGPWNSAGTMTATTQTVSNLSPATSYYVQVVPEDSVSGSQGPATVAGPFQTSSSSTGSWWTTAPSQAAAAGFTTLKFGDDFTSSSTITLTNSTSQRNFNWYPASWGGKITTSIAQLNPTWMADDNNMLAQGVSLSSPTLTNMSPAGGIVRLQGGASNATLMSVDGWISTMPATGIFRHGYFEAYIQFRPGDCNAAVCSHGWPAFWMWSIEGMRALGFGGSTFSGPYTEIDCFEYAVASNNIAWGGSAFHGSMNGGGYGLGSITTDNNWHTIGCLWTPGKIQFYYDNKPVGSGTTTSSALESEHQFIMIGCGTTVTAPFTIPMYVDWVRVWQ